MAYTLEQLTLAYKAVHDGIAPSAATLANFETVAALSALGQLTDAQILATIINSADGTTALAVLSYQFFTGKSPSKAGLDYLVNSPVNGGDLNDPYYARFGLENRYINFATNLGVNGEGAARFAAQYGAMSFGEYVAAIYQTIIGASYAQAAGVDAAKAIADIVGRKDAILATAQGAGIITPGMTAAQVDLAVKAAAAGYLLGEAIKADVGLYAAAASNFMAALATGTAVYNTDITQTYQPNVDSIAHGTGKAADRGAVLPVPVTPSEPAGPAPPQSLALTLAAGVNTVNGGGGDDTFTGTDTTFTGASVLNGGAGNDTLTLTGSGGGFNVPNATVSGIETVKVSNTNGVSVDTNGWTGVNTLNVTAQASAVIKAASTTNVILDTTNQGGGFIEVWGGHDVTVTAGLGPGAITIGQNNIYPTGAVKVNVTGGGANGVLVNGGTTVESTQEEGPFVAVGGPMTTSVKLKVTLAPYLVDVIDYHDNTGTLGTIKTIDIDGYSGAPTLRVSGVTTLKLANGNGDIDMQRGGPASVPTTLDLTLSNVTMNLLTDSANAYATINVTMGPQASTVGNFNNGGLTTLNIAGASKLTFSTGLAQNLTNLDASAMTAGGIDWTSGALNSAVTVKGAATSANVIDASTSNATIAYTGGTAADTVTVNALANTIDVKADAAVDTVKIGAPGATGAVFTTISHLAAGDKLDLTAVNSGMTSLAAPTALGAQPSLAAALNIAAAGNGAGTPILAWFTWGGDTYVVADRSAGGSFVDGADYVVKLVGTSLTTASIAGTVLTFA